MRGVASQGKKLSESRALRIHIIYYIYSIEVFDSSSTTVNFQYQEIGNRHITARDKLY